MILDRHSHSRISPFWFSRHPTLAGRALAPVLPFAPAPGLVILTEPGLAPIRLILEPCRFNTNPLNDVDLAEFIELQKLLADSDKSWSSPLLKKS